MDIPPQDSGEQSNVHQTTNPLGGRIHTPRRSEPAQRLWSGYVALIRKCPGCGWENDEWALFCVSCAADLRQVKPVASSDSRPGVALVEKRLRRERRTLARHRADDSPGGGGWIACGAALILAALIVGPDRTISVAIWFAAVACAITGIWQIRSDQKALRLWGMFLAGGAASLLMFVGFRAIQASEAFNDPDGSLVVASPTLVTGATVESSPPAILLGGNIPMYRGGPLHDGQMPGPAPDSSPLLFWQFDTGGEVYSSPVLADGILYLTSKSGDIHAIDAITGAVVWQREVTTYVTRASPAVVDGVVYVGSGFSFSALDAATGEERWSVPLQYGGQASPTVHDGLVIVSSQQSWIYALTIETGEIAWRIPTEGIVFGSTAITANQAFYGTDEGIVYSINPKTGTLKWRSKVPGSIYATPVVNNDLVYITTQSGELFALDGTTGDRVWSVDHGSSEPPAVNGDVVVLTASDGGVYGLDAATGDQRWLYPSGKKSLTAPAITGNLAIFGAGDSLLALDITTGKALWYYLAGDTIESSPVVADGFVFFGSRDGFLTAVTDRQD